MENFIKTYASDTDRSGGVPLRKDALCAREVHDILTFTIVSAGRLGYTKYN